MIRTKIFKSLEKVVISLFHTVVTFFFNSPTTPLMFVQENQQLYHYFFLPSLTWRTPFLTVPAVHLNFTTTFGLCCEDCYEEKSDQLKLALNI